MSYLAPASFHFVRGIIKVIKGSDIANLASLEVLASVMLQVKVPVIKPVFQNVDKKSHITYFFARFLAGLDIKYGNSKVKTLQVVFLLCYI